MKEAHYHVYIGELPTGEEAAMEIHVQLVARGPGPMDRRILDIDPATGFPDLAGDLIAGFLLRRMNCREIREAIGRAALECLSPGLAGGYKAFADRPAPDGSAPEGQAVS